MPSTLIHKRLQPFLEAGVLQSEREPMMAWKTRLLRIHNLAFPGETPLQGNEPGLLGTAIAGMHDHEFGVRLLMQNNNMELHQLFRVAVFRENKDWPVHTVPDNDPEDATAPNDDHEDITSEEDDWTTPSDTSSVGSGPGPAEPANEEETTPPASSTPSRAQTPTSTTPATPVRNQGRQQPVSCWHCSGNHLRRHCPVRQQAVVLRAVERNRRDAIARRTLGSTPTDEKTPRQRRMMLRAAAANRTTTSTGEQRTLTERQANHNQAVRNRICNLRNLVAHHQRLLADEASLFTAWTCRLPPNTDVQVALTDPRCPCNACRAAMINALLDRITALESTLH